MSLYKEVLLYILHSSDPVNKFHTGHREFACKLQSLICFHFLEILENLLRSIIPLTI